MPLLHCAVGFAFRHFQFLDRPMVDGSALFLMITTVTRTDSFSVGDLLCHCKFLHVQIFVFLLRLPDFVVHLLVHPAFRGGVKRFGQP